MAGYLRHAASPIKHVRWIIKQLDPTWGILSIEYADYTNHHFSLWACWILYGTFFPTILERTELLLPSQMDLIFEVGIQSGNLLYPFIASVFRFPFIVLGFSCLSCKSVHAFAVFKWTIGRQNKKFKVQGWAKLHSMCKHDTVQEFLCFISIFINSYFSIFGYQGWIKIFGIVSDNVPMEV